MIRPSPQSVLPLRASPKESSVRRFVELICRDQKDVMIYKSTSEDFRNHPGAKNEAYFFKHVSNDNEFECQVMAAYIYLSNNFGLEYDSGEEDTLCILGASSGARAARAFAALVYQRGVERNVFGVHTMYYDFVLGGSFGEVHSAMTFGQRIRIAFLGLWDCTGNVSFWPDTFPNEIVNHCVDCIRHAVARGDRCVKNRPLLYHSVPVAELRGLERRRTWDGYESIAVLERNIHVKPLSPSVPDVGIKEVLFPGDHMSVAYNTGSQLSDAPFLWMIQEFKRRFPTVRLHPPKLNGQSPTISMDSNISIDGNSRDNLLSNPGEGEDAKIPRGRASKSPGERRSLIHYNRCRIRRILTRCVEECVPKLCAVSTPDGKPKRKVIWNLGRKRNFHGVEGLEEWTPASLV